MRPLYFVSGASAPADIRGLARFSVPFGVSLTELSAAGLEVICEHRRWRGSLHLHERRAALFLSSWSGRFATH